MNGGSLGSSAQSFNITVERDVLALLQLVRTSMLDEESKNAIRDLVFALRTEITEQRVSELQMYLSPIQAKVVGGAARPAASDTERVLEGVSVSVPTPTVPTSPVVSTAPMPAPAEPVKPVRTQTVGGRPTPTFAAPATKVSEELAPATHAESTPTTAPVVEERVDPVTKSDPTPAPVPAPAIESEAASEPLASTQAADLVAPTAPEIPVATVSDKPPAAQSSTQGAPDANQRIAEIKRAVNQAVGNPVNLIDANNEVGREYMNALLEAMKATNSSTNVPEAMGRLETAYVAVQKTLATGIATVDTVPHETPADTPPPAPPTQVATPPAESAAVADAVPAPTVNTKDTDASADRWHAAAAVPVPEQKAAEPAVPSTPSVPPTPPTPSVSAPKVVSADATAASAASATAATNNPTPLQSVAASADAIAASRPTLPDQTPVTNTTGDPLMSETVTAGLTQLLTEWKMFKAGGILGTGPKGLEHPLYQALKDMPMNLVIAGRFEGATPEVKQSIHDYMNGWRYEQGITHDLQETFEHYLRRVVKTIIDKHE